MINGILLLDKPKGISSNTAANKVKYLFHAEKAGHLGTLDVLGHGLLPITLGRCTKLFDYFLKKDKVYEANFKFGVETDTLDLEGEIIKVDSKKVSKEEILPVLHKLIGKQMQMPPQYSAKKINGKKAYDLARNGQVADLKPKEIEIYNLELIDQIGDNEFRFRIHCSSGTYIRSICRDIASELSTCGLMSDIIRTKCGIFELKDACSFEDIEHGKYKLINPEIVFDYEKISLNFEDTQRLYNGASVFIDKDDGLYKIYEENIFLGIGRVQESMLKFEIRL